MLELKVLIKMLFDSILVSKILSPVLSLMLINIIINSVYTVRNEDYSKTESLTLLISALLKNKLFLDYKTQITELITKPKGSNAKGSLKWLQLTLDSRKFDYLKSETMIYIFKIGGEEFNDNSFKFFNVDTEKKLKKKFKFFFFNDALKTYFGRNKIVLMKG